MVLDPTKEGGGKCLPNSSLGHKFTLFPVLNILSRAPNLCGT